MAVFHESTSAAIRSYFPTREDAASFLNLINVWWTISNSKTKYNNNNYLGNAAVPGDGKIEFLVKMADWIEEWSKCPYFTLTAELLLPWSEHIAQQQQIYSMRDTTTVPPLTRLRWPRRLTALLLIQLRTSAVQYAHFCSAVREIL